MSDEKPHRMDERLLKRLDLIGIGKDADTYEDRKTHDLWEYIGNRPEHWWNSKYWLKIKEGRR